MVAEVRAGLTLREVSSRYGVAPETVRRWVLRAAGTRVDRAMLEDLRPGRRRAANRVTPEVEALVVQVRERLRTESALGEHGARAIRDELDAAGVDAVPSVRTIGRILERTGALGGPRRTRRPPPPRGWYLPEVASARAELDSFDVIEGLTTLQDKHFEVLTAISLWGRWVSAWAEPQVTARTIVDRLLDRWREIGLPSYVQFDNDTRFHGPHFHEATVGRVSRVCLQLGVRVVFAAPHEHGPQADIESFNLRWQRGVRGRLFLPALADVRVHSERFVTAHRVRHATPLRAAGLRAAFPDPWQPDLQRAIRGTMIFLRRADESGRVRVMRRPYDTAPTWAHRLTRSEVDFDAGEVRIFGLRRSHPTEQLLLRVHPFRTPQRGRFAE